MLLLNYTKCILVVLRVWGSWEKFSTANSNYSPKDLIFYEIAPKKFFFLGGGVKIVLSWEPSKVPQRTKKVQKMKYRTKNGSKNVIQNHCWFWFSNEPFLILQPSRTISRGSKKEFFIEPLEMVQGNLKSQKSSLLNLVLYHIFETFLVLYFMFGIFFVLWGTFEGFPGRTILEAFFLSKLVHRKLENSCGGMT